MGYIKHDAIIVTSYSKEYITEARNVAKDFKLRVLPIEISKMNGYFTFLIIPDGSSEGWAESKQGDQARAAWIKWKRENVENYVDWVHVRYGGDEPEFTKIEDHNHGKGGDP